MHSGLILAESIFLRLWYGTLYFKHSFLLLFLHNSHGTKEILDCGNLVRPDWVENLRWHNTEAYEPFRWVNTEPSVQFRKANMDPSVQFRKANTDPSVQFRKASTDPSVQFRNINKTSIIIINSGRPIRIRPCILGGTIRNYCLARC